MGDWIEEGAKAPDFTLVAHDGTKLKLSSLKGSRVVLGVSPDGPESHAKFRTKYSLPFTLLCDPDHVVAEKYGAWREKTLYGKKSLGIVRSTFVIDEQGRVTKVFRAVRADGHAEQVLAALAGD
jgi:peroxiredoxin Q/BCP